jgi:hypothetical protein
MRLGSRNSRQEDRRTVELLRRLPPHILQGPFGTKTINRKTWMARRRCYRREVQSQNHNNYQSRLELELCLRIDSNGRRKGYESIDRILGLY